MNKKCFLLRRHELLLSGQRMCGHDCVWHLRRMCENECVCGGEWEWEREGGRQEVRVYINSSNQDFNLLNVTCPITNAWSFRQVSLFLFIISRFSGRTDRNISIQFQPTLDAASATHSSNSRERQKNTTFTFLSFFKRFYVIRRPDEKDKDLL